MGSTRNCQKSGGKKRFCEPEFQGMVSMCEPPSLPLDMIHPAPRVFVDVGLSLQSFTVRNFTVAFRQTRSKA